MGIRSLFNRVLGTDSTRKNKRPSSLGSEQSKNEEKTYNLGSNQLADECPEEPKEDNKMQGGNGAKTCNNSKMTSTVYNLIILDESGSMDCVRDQTISGCNETLNSIRCMAKEHDEIKQLVSIFCFDTSKSRYIFKNVPIEETRDLTREDYCPNSCTPLYDAIGYTVSQLKQLITDLDSVGVVTIITDGYENASQRWGHHSIVKLIENLKKKGWVFTFIGANIDVKRTAQDLNINSYLEFCQTDEGMSEMFKKESRSRRAYNEKRRYMKSSSTFDLLSLESQEEALGALNDNYFIEDERFTPDVIKCLEEDEIFVFGSNVDGLHTGGASFFALRYLGAKMGQAEGIQGQSYAIPTVGNTFEELKEAIMRFNEYVVLHPKNKFILTAIGCGNAGYGIEQIAPLFRQAYAFGNVFIPREFLRYMDVSTGV